MKQEVNDLLRAGLALSTEPSSVPERFETKALPLGKPRLDNFDDVAEVLAFAEGESHL